MTYQEWYEEHANKHKTIVEKLQKKGLSKEEIVEYFDFENMVKMEKDFCLLYSENKKCHDVKTLNCYLCACPHFRFKDEGFEKIENKTKYSFCSIDAKDGKTAIYGDAIHQDCSACTVPHHKSYILKNFDYDWKNIMKKCVF